MPDTSSTRPPEHEEPIYWFYLLEVAINNGDFEAAARAKAELEQLGVTVTYKRRQRGREVAHA